MSAKTQQGCKVSKASKAAKSARQARLQSQQGKQGRNVRKAIKAATPARLQRQQGKQCTRTANSFVPRSRLLKRDRRAMLSGKYLSWLSRSSTTSKPVKLDYCKYRTRDFATLVTLDVGTIVENLENEVSEIEWKLSILMQLQAFHILANFWWQLLNLAIVEVQMRKGSKLSYRQWKPWK